MSYNQETIQKNVARWHQTQEDRAARLRVRKLMEDARRPAVQLTHRPFEALDKAGSR